MQDFNDNDLDALYSALIVDHSRRPHHFGTLKVPPAKTLEAFNPLCGDRFSLYLDLDGATIKQLTFQGSGCAISTASLSILTDLVHGKTLSEACDAIEAFTALLTGAALEPKKLTTLGKAAALAGVKAFPMRVKCATLGWHALQQLLESK